MPPRSPKKQGTREKLLHAAARCFARKGYAACTVADIAAEAGLGQGSLYVHFKNKEALFLEMIAHEHAQGTDKARDAMNDAPSIQGVIRILDSCVRDVGFPVDHALWTEILAVAARDAAVREAFQASDRQMREALVDLLKAAAGRGDVDPNLDLEAVSIWLYSLVDGLIARKAIEEDFDMERHCELFAELVCRALKAPPKQET